MLSFFLRSNSHIHTWLLEKPWLWLHRLLSAKWCLCFLICWTLLSPPDTSTTERLFHFGPASSFFQELFLYSSLTAYWTSSDLGVSSSSVISFCLFILFVRFSRWEYCSGLPFPSPMDHVLSELSMRTCLSWSWVALKGITHSFTELYKPLCNDKAVIYEEERRGWVLLFKGKKRREKMKEKAAPFKSSSP